MRRKSGKRGKWQTLAPLPWLSDEPETPPPIQVANGRVVRGHWRDPDDTSTATRIPREIRGWRRTCPIRRSLAQHGDRSIFTALHLAAADKLRAVYDLARLGCGGAWHDGLPVTARLFRPSLGPSKGAFRQWQAVAEFRAAWSAPASDAQRRIFNLVILQNMPCRTAAAALGVSHTRLPELLVAALDLLAVHFGLREDRDAA